MGSGKGSKSYISGYRYYAGLHLSFCQFADKILRINVGDKIAWTGSVTSNSSIYIDQPELFGGDGREGGIVGTVDVCFGAPTQDKNPYLMSVLGTTVIPAYRGLLSLICNKVMVAANNPYIKEWSLMAQRTQTGWRTDYADIPADDGYIDMNPAHIIRDALTNHSWGTLGYPESDLDEDSFFATALTLWNEGFGLSLLWGTDSSVEEFIRIVLDHINAVLYVSHTTGKVKLKLIRKDYVIGTLPVVDDSSVIELVNFSTPGSTEVINQVVLTYVDRENRPNGVTVQDIAGINRCQGQINSKTIPMPGVSSASWAAKLASRELQQLAVPMSSITVVVTRKNFMLEEGDCFVFNRPSIGISGMVMRIVSVDIGTIDESSLRVTAVRDVYNLGAIAFVTPQSSSWSNPRNPPAPAIRRKLFELNWWQFVVDLYGDSAAVLAEIDNTSTHICSVCGQPSQDATNYEMWGRNVGATDFTYKDTDSFPFIATLSTSVVPEVQSTLTLSVDYLDTNMVRVGAYAILEDEWVSVISRDPISKTVVVARGIFDTIPVSHPAGAYLWFHQGLFGFDSTERAVGEQVEVRLLPATGIGRLDIGSAPSDTITLVGRMMRPYPPGNFQINSSRWPSSIAAGRELKVSWAHRDRTIQTVSHNRQDEGDIGPETGTTYNLKIYGNAGVLKRTLTGLTANSYTYLIADELTDNGSPVGNLGYLKLALPMDGTSGTNTFVDLKNHTVTANGNVALSDTEEKYGNTSAYFDGAGDFLTIDSSDLTFGTADFTIELWVWRSATPVTYNKTLFFQNSSNTGFYLEWTTGDLLSLHLYGDSSDTASTGTFNLSAWNHVALTRESGVFKIWLNGVLEGSKTLASDCAASIFYIGRRTDATNYDYSGYIDDFLVRPGIAIYTAAFTPPASIVSQLSGLNSSLRVELESVRESLTSLNKWDVSTVRA